MWIMVSGPYTAGGADKVRRTQNLRAMNAAAVNVLRLGHVPIIGVNMALPMLEVAGEGSFDEIMMPLSLSLCERCDACLRIGGASAGADQEVERFRAARKPVYFDVSDIPACPKAPTTNGP